MLGRRLTRHAGGPDTLLIRYAHVSTDTLGLTTQRTACTPLELPRPPSFKSLGTRLATTKVVAPDLFDASTASSQMAVAYRPTGKPLR